MARVRKTGFIATKQNGDLKEYRARYRTKRPLLQGRVPASVYREAQRRAAAVDFSLSKWLGYWLQLTFADHPLEELVTNQASLTPPEVAFHKYMALLNQINRIGVHGFARVLDESDPIQLAELVAAADTVQRHIDRVVK